MSDLRELDSLKITLVRQSKKVNPKTNKKDRTRTIISDNIQTLEFKSTIKRGNKDMFNDPTITNVHEDEISFETTIIRRDENDHITATKIENDFAAEFVHEEEEDNPFVVKIHRENEPETKFVKIETPVAPVEETLHVEELVEETEEDDTEEIAEEVEEIEEEETSEIEVEEVEEESDDEGTEDDEFITDPEEEDLEEDEEFEDDDDEELTLEEVDIDDDRYLDLIPHAKMEKLKTGDPVLDNF